MSDAPEVWVDHDYTPLPRESEKCGRCRGDLILQHVCTDHVVVPRATIIDAIQGRDWEAIREWLN